MDLTLRGPRLRWRYQHDAAGKPVVIRNPATAQVEISSRCMCGAELTLLAPVFGAGTRAVLDEPTDLYCSEACLARGVADAVALAAASDLPVINHRFKRLTWDEVRAAVGGPVEPCTALSQSRMTLSVAPGGPLPHPGLVNRRDEQLVNYGPRLTPAELEDG